jgi:hypothetical protein
MKGEMATLYSRFAARRPAFGLAFCENGAERIDRIKAMFCDVFRQSCRGTVAKRRQSATAAWLLVAALLDGCASGGGLAAGAPAEARREAVASRAKARWEALIKADVAGAYEFLSPASKATTPLDVYKAKHRVGLYRAVSVDGVNCEADVCTVNLTLTYDFKRFKGVRTPLVEKWVISQGQAWFVEQG